MSRRIKWLDFAKGFTILSVILIHIPSPVTSFFLIFAMPVFFAISGYLYSPTNNWCLYKIMIYKKVTSFGVPYITFSLFLLIKRLIKGKFIITYLYLPMAYLWFLYCLFIIFVLVGLFDVLHVNLYIQMSIYIILMIIQMPLSLKISKNGNVNPIAGICGYISCFYIGYIIKHYHLMKILKNIKISIIIDFIWLLLVIDELYFLGNKVNNDMFYYSNFIVKLLSIPVFFSFFKLFPENNIVFKYLDKYGKYTLIIYLVHFPIISILKKLPIQAPFFKFCIMLLIAWYGSLFVYYLSKKNNIINFVFYPRKYINKIILKTKWGEKFI